MSSLKTYAAAAEPFTRVITQVVSWDAPSPCEGWTARDVLDHVLTTQADFLTGHGIDLSPADTAHPVAAWTTRDAELRAILADPELDGHPYQGWFGPTTVGETLATFYGWDLLVHRWDVAVADGRNERFSDAELDLIDGAADGFGDTLYAEGICQPAVPVGADADRQERVLARLGRRPVRVGAGD